jgi:hemerythrin superfamily protein
MKPSAGMKESLWQHLRESHRHLEAVLADVQKLASGQSFVTAAKRFGEFRLQEERHLHLENELLEILEKSLGCPRFDRIRNQHERIVQLMDELTALLSSWDLPAFQDCLEEFVELLAAHEADERESVLPKAETELKDIPAYQTLLWRVGHP